MKIKPHQYQHIANGIQRMELAAIDAQLTLFVRPSENGTIYTNRFKSMFNSIHEYEKYIIDSFTNCLKKEIDDENDKVLQSIINGDESVKGIIANNSILFKYDVPDLSGDIVCNGAFDKHFRPDSQVDKSFIPFRL